MLPNNNRGKNQHLQGPHKIGEGRNQLLLCFSQDPQPDSVLKPKKAYHPLCSNFCGNLENALGSPMVAISCGYPVGWQRKCCRNVPRELQTLGPATLNCMVAGMLVPMNQAENSPNPQPNSLIGPKWPPFLQLPCAWIW